MAEPEKLKATARNLMKMALACLDEAGERGAAVHLQHAVDVLNKTPNIRPGEKVPDEHVEHHFTACRRG